jgi:2-oxoisovalerate ferredoxin oxidoreductase beta subunit
VDAQRFVREEMAEVFPVANFRDRTRDATPRPAAPPPPAIAEIPALLGLVAEDDGALRPRPERPLDLRMRVAGFGGQGVLTLGYVLAEAGMEAGYEVSWLPSYGPEMRSGTSNCHVRLSNEPISSPLVSRPNVLLALNEPSLRKFLPDVEPGGIVLYNSDTLPADCMRSDLRIVARHFSGLADKLGDPKVGNVVMLGALLEATGLLEPEQIVSALRALVKNKKYLDLDLLALQLGQDEVRKEPLPVCDDDLWGV